MFCRKDIQVSNHLRTIVAHEFGHSAHNIISNEAGMNWGQLEWTHPLIWLYQEGAATHFSRQTVKTNHPSVYYSYNDSGYEWLAFAEAYKKEILLEFAKDYLEQPSQALYLEWFSINGGKKFGHSRLAYYIGDLFFQKQIERLGEWNAIIAWKEEDFIANAEKWLLQGEC